MPHHVKPRRLPKLNSSPPSSRVLTVRREFGLPSDLPACVLPAGRLPRLRPGEIVLISGPSGAGKTALLRQIASRTDRSVAVQPDRLPSRRAVIDLVAPRGPLSSAMKVLTACGLGEPRLWTRREAELSDGERFRVALARAVGRALHGDGRTTILCDEFTATVHRRLARCIAYNLRKLVSRMRLSLICATSHEDVAADLQPDTHIRLGGPSACISHHTPQPRPPSLQRSLCIERGRVADYTRFAPMHYRRCDAIGFGVTHK